MSREYRETRKIPGVVQKAGNWIGGKAKEAKRYLVGYKSKIVINPSTETRATMNENDILTNDNELFTYLFADSAHTTRHNNISKYFDYYKGDHAILTEERRTSRNRNTIVVNYCVDIIDKGVDILIGKPFTTENEISVNDDEMNYDICKQASIAGDAWVVIYDKVEEDGSSGKKYMTISGEEAYPLFIDNELVFFARRYKWKNLAGVEEEKVVAYDKDSIRFYISNDLGQTILDNGYTDNPYTSVSGGLNYIKDPDQETIYHGLGKLPIIHFPNIKARSTDIYGESDLANIVTLQDAVNENESDWSDVLRYHGFPQMVAKNIDGVVQSAATAISDEMDKRGTTPTDTTGYNSLTRMLRSVEDILVINGDGADIVYVSRDTNTSYYETKAEEMRSNIYKITATPDLDVFTKAGNVAGVVIDALYKPAKIKAERKAMMYNDKFKELFALMGEDSGDITFNFNIPVNVTEKMAEVQTLINLGLIDTESALEMLPNIEDKEKVKQRLQEGLKEQATAMGVETAPSIQNKGLIDKVIEKQRMDKQAEMAAKNPEMGQGGNKWTTKK